MIRWLNPTVFIAGGLYVRHYNATHSGSKLLFPLLEPLAGPEVEAQATLTWQISVGLGGLFLVLAIWGTLRDFRARRAAAADE